MLDPKTMTFILFYTWAICTFLVFYLQIFKPRTIQGKLTPVKSYRDHIMLVGLMAWVAMVCFSTKW
jgi:hypothetical protein